MAWFDALAKHTQDFEFIIIDERHSPKGGFAEKLNIGLKFVQGDYIVFLHDDAEVTPGWLDVLPKNGVGAFKVGEQNDKFDCWGGFLNPLSFCTDPTQNPDYSYWLCVSREAMEKIGPFDERYKKPWYQDCDTGMQVKKAGYKIECLPGKIIHRCAPGSGKVDERQVGYFNRKWNISN